MKRQINLISIELFHFDAFYNYSKDTNRIITETSDLGNCRHNLNNKLYLYFMHKRRVKQLEAYLAGNSAY